jgi:hypothetical protein
MTAEGAETQAGAEAREKTKRRCDVSNTAVLRLS